MTPSELVEMFRDEVADTEAPYLWSDALVLQYLDDAQTMFCRKTDGISDATTAEVTEIEVAPGTVWYDTHPKILKIRSAIRTDTGKPVKVLNVEDMASQNMFFDGRTGPLQALIVGMEANKAAVWPAPNETVTVKLTVFRLPLAALTEDSSLEVAAEHHQHLLHWVKHRAYLKQDAETLDKRKSQEFEERFLAYCMQVQVEERRKRHKFRTVVYGGL